LGQKIACEVQHLILMGQNAHKIQAAVKEYPYKTNIHIVNTLEEGVQLARQISQPGDTITLSPASASFGMFRNFVERAQIFQDIVAKYFSES